jgi:hypothetical protein
MALEMDKVAAVADMDAVDMDAADMAVADMAGDEDDFYTLARPLYIIHCIKKYNLTLLSKLILYYLRLRICNTFTLHMHEILLAC